MNVNKIKLSRLNILKESTKTVPVFFACDDNYVKYLMVVIRSLIDNSSIAYDYKIYVLHTNVTEENKNKVYAMQTSNVFVDFVDVSGELAKIEKKLSVRDYYSLTTYYRIFIADMFPQYDKVIYLDSDIVLNRDIADMYKYNLGTNYVGATRDYLVANTDLFGDYVENVLGISRSAYFNAGVLIINAKAYRKNHLKRQFVDLLNTYTFVVAQDQDYLNVLCRDKILWIDSKWNVQMSEPAERPYNKIGLVHYNFAQKPWHVKTGKYADLFWKYAEKTADIDALRVDLASYSEADEKRDFLSGQHLMKLAEEEINNEKNYLNMFGDTIERGVSRQEIIEKIKQYEREGRFDEDVEDDPPGRMIMPDEIDYLDNSMSKRLTTRYAYKMARWFLKTMIRRKMFIIKEIKGIENYKKLSTGAIITCNHFNAFDSFAMQIAYEKSGQYRRKFYRIIKEANYTSFPGFYGFLMRNCNTLPLSSNKATMKKLMKAVDTLLQKGHFVLIYPEQSLWWNYRKPKPLKKGGFIFAARNNVPVLPCFITMNDSKYPGEGGLPVQEYTIHIAEPIYPDPNKTRAENVKNMMEANFETWKNIYEYTYGIPLTYETQKPVNVVEE